MPRSEGLHVLIAEDMLVNQIVAIKMLEKLGHLPKAVSNGKEALKELQLGSYGLILMDCEMPEMDGYEATRRILELAPDLPVIGQTAHAMLDERRECLAAGMVDHIAKPIDFKLLVDMIVRQLG